VPSFKLQQANEPRLEFSLELVITHKCIYSEGTYRLSEKGVCVIIFAYIYKVTNLDILVHSLMQ